MPSLFRTSLRLALPCVAFLLASIGPALRGAPALDLASLSADTANLALTASPGRYTIQTSADLAAPWQDAFSIVLDGAGHASFALPVPAGATRRFFRARTNDSVVLETTGADFTAIVTCADAGASPVLWRWSDGTTGVDYPAAARSFGAAAPRQHSLELVAPARLTKFNIGFNGADGGGATPLDPLVGQNVSRITFPAPLADLTSFGATHNHGIREIDFTGFTSLEYLECYECGGLEHVQVTDLPALRRLCVEACALTELDLSGLPNLEDVRGALNEFTSITVGRGTGPKIWHWCTRDNPQMTQNFADIMGNFAALEELYIWNTNQTGTFQVGSLVLRDLQAFQNHFTDAHLAGNTQLHYCHFGWNELADIDLAGCTGLRDLNLSNNRLTAPVLDRILAFLDTSAPNLATVDLTRNWQPPSATGLAHANNLVARGVTVAIDIPEANDGRIDVAGGANAITFTTSSAQPHLEIRITGTPSSVVWHWGDGTIAAGTTAGAATHRFASAAPHTNYVEVVPASCVTSFGAQNGYTGQGITGASGLANFPNLATLNLYQESLSNLDVSGCTALRECYLADNALGASEVDNILAALDTHSTNLTYANLTGNTAPSAAGLVHVQNLRDRGANVLVDLAEQNDGRIDVPGGANAITFTTDSQQPHMEIRFTGTPTSIVWHWGDGTITTGGVSTHRFASATAHTNYVEVFPADSVTYFGAQMNYTNQGITGVVGAAHFPNLNFLYLYQESVSVLDIAGCANLRQLHLADNPVSPATCDKWFIDLDAAVVGPVTGADFFFPAAARTAASDAAYQRLVAKGYTMQPY